MSRARHVTLALAVAAALLAPAAARADSVATALPPGAFTDVTAVVPGVDLDIRYATAHNFTGAPIPGYEEPRCLLTVPAAQALARVQAAVAAEGYRIKIYDCFRPQRSVDAFVRWGKRLGDQRMKAEFYPRVRKARVFAEGYIAAKSGHSRGSTLDLSLEPLRGARADGSYRRGQRLVDCAAPQAERFPDASIDMGTGYDCFDPLSHPYNGRITGRQRANRLVLRRAMLAAGFGPLATEWWHFTLRDEPFPDTRFDVPVADASVR